MRARVSFLKYSWRVGKYRGRPVSGALLLGASHVASPHALNGVSVGLVESLISCSYQRPVPCVLRSQRSSHLEFVVGKLRQAKRSQQSLQLVVLKELWSKFGAGRPEKEPSALSQPSMLSVVFVMPFCEFECQLNCDGDLTQACEAAKISPNSTDAKAVRCRQLGQAPQTACDRQLVAKGLALKSNLIVSLI